MTTLNPAVLMSPSPSRPNRRVMVVAWLMAVWMLATAAAFAYVGKYGRNVPSWDDWDIVPTMTGSQSVTWHWLWSQHNEHRVPVARLVMLAVYRIWPDFRAGMIFNVALMSVMTAALMICIARQRGTFRWTDAFFPLVTLHLGQGLNFMWGWQIEFFTSTAFVLGWLLLVTTSRSLTRERLLAVLVLSLLLAGSGAHGLALLPAITGWLVGDAIIARRRNDLPAGPRHALLKLTVAFISVALIAVYMMGWEKVPHHPGSPGLSSSAITAVKAVTMSFGSAVKPAWPISGIVVISLVIMTLGRLVKILRRDPAERVRAWGMFCVIGGLLSLALALGLGRDGFEARYVTLLFPLLCAIYAVWTIYPPLRWPQAIPVTLLICSAAAFFPNARSGIYYARDVRAHLAAFEKDLHAGKSTPSLIAHHYRYLHPQHALLADYLPMLQSAGIQPYTNLQKDFSTVEQTVPIEDLTITGATRVGTTLQHDGHASIDLTLPAMTRVIGVKMTYSFSNPIHRQPIILIKWRKDGQTFDGQKREYRYFPTGDRDNWERGSYTRTSNPLPAVECYIDDDISHLQIVPDYVPGSFTIEKLVLMVAPP